METVKAPRGALVDHQLTDLTLTGALTFFRLGIKPGGDEEEEEEETVQEQLTKLMSPKNHRGGGAREEHWTFSALSLKCGVMM